MNVAIFIGVFTLIRKKTLMKVSAPSVMGKLKLRLGRGGQRHDFFQHDKIFL